MVMGARLGPEFDVFVRTSSPGLLRLATLLVRESGAAEDLLQVALARTARHWGDAQRDPAAYTRRTIANLAKNRWRDKSRRPREVQDLTGIEPVQASDADLLVERDAVSRLVANLPMGQRKVLVLRFFEDLTVADVATILGCTEGNVKSQTSRALASLRESLHLLTDAQTEAKHA